MGNIITYLEKFGHLTFKEMPFNEVDALVLSQFSYLKFDGLVPKLTDMVRGIRLADMVGRMKEEVVFSDERFEKNNRLLFAGMVKSNRFSNMSCNFYATILDENVETQFCALTCFLKDSVPIVVFRGTDESIVGWKEDFNMAFKEPVPAQKLAAMYLGQAAIAFAGDFYVCGHSKGGNLAVYSSMNTYMDIRNRIKRIYTFDGPGFRPEILNSEDYDAIAERIEKYIPKSSLVGMILESHEEYTVVDSYSIGLLQHDPYTWRVEEASFVPRKEVDKGRKIMNVTLNEWILKLDDEQVEVFVDTVFDILNGCDVKTLIEMTVDWKKSITGMRNAYRDVKEETRETIREGLRLFFDVLKENLKKM